MHSPTDGIKQCCIATRLPVRLSVCPMPLVQDGVVEGYGYYGSLIGSHVLKVEPTGQRGHSGRRSIVSPSSGRYIVRVMDSGWVSA